jgi:hypothetical protein
LETSSHHVAQAGFELEILLPQPLECWDSRHHHAWLKLYISRKQISFVANSQLSVEKREVKAISCEHLINSPGSSFKFLWPKPSPKLKTNVNREPKSQA